MNNTELMKKVFETFGKIESDISDEEGKYQVGDLTLYYSMLFQVGFASIEKVFGVETTQDAFYNTVDYIFEVLKQGGYDKEHDFLKRLNLEDYGREKRSKQQ